MKRAKIKLILTDCDGVLTDSGMYYFDNGLEAKKFNICTISNQLAKGLEFDAVIINGVNEYNYSSSSNLDMKLLYVAITRALHELDIVYNSELTKPLNKNRIYK